VLVSLVDSDGRALQRFMVGPTESSASSSLPPAPIRCAPSASE